MLHQYPGLENISQVAQTEWHDGLCQSFQSIGSICLTERSILDTRFLQLPENAQRWAEKQTKDQSAHCVEAIICQGQCHANGQEHCPWGNYLR